ncbi:MAG: 23S rRNA (adenine(2503)-C(2))-methyltransferase RlmN [Candidatus Ancillula sp.]|jgi:23S rRNA (adenine2503-C2)-methyltransferase|nr:23S rRNA (adenine(2503)-C(2))-methyltransferase RlmN [Candidatus Ancillula sp.]
MHFVDKIDLSSKKRYPDFRIKQLANHYFQHYSVNYEEWSDIPQEMGKKMQQDLLPEIVKIELQQFGDTDNLGKAQTVKNLLLLEDGNRIESVLMHYPDVYSEFSRVTLCLSTQVGCAMGCDFCATGKLGLKRNLTRAEIIEQVRLAFVDTQKQWGDQARLSNIVFMGMGEPTANLQNILDAVELITDDKVNGFGLSAKNITISTVGDVKGIKALAEDKHLFRLAISLHAATDDLRSKLMPMNKKYNVEQVLQAGYDYFQKKKRRVSIEYALIKDINDTGKQAQTLANKLNRQGQNWVHVNLIPLNEVPGSKWTASSKKQTEIFENILKEKGIPVTLRNSRGQDIDGACGQLANQKEKGKES